MPEPFRELEPETEAGKAFVRAVKDGDAQQLRAVQTENGATIDLQSAAGLGRLDLVREFLDAAPDWFPYLNAEIEAILKTFPEAIVTED